MSHARHETTDHPQESVFVRAKIIYRVPSRARFLMKRNYHLFQRYCEITNTLRHVSDVGEGCAECKLARFD